MSAKLNQIRSGKDVGPSVAKAETSLRVIWVSQCSILSALKTKLAITGYFTCAAQSNGAAKRKAIQFVPFFLQLIAHCTVRAVFDDGAVPCHFQVDDATISARLRPARRYDTYFTNRCTLHVAQQLTAPLTTVAVSGIMLYVYIPANDSSPTKAMTRELAPRARLREV